MPKKPLASWMRLVAMINIVICARIRPLDCIGSPSSAFYREKLDLAMLPSSRRAASIHGLKARLLSHGVLATETVIRTCRAMLRAQLSHSLQQEP